MLSTIPAWILAAFAASLATSGIEGSWLLPAHSLYLRWILSIALHGAWLLPDIRRRAPAAAVSCWLLSAWFCRRALDPAAPRTLGALLIEGLPLLLLMTPRTWAERLTRWRRAQSAITTQLRLATGLVPWFREAAQAFLHGSAQPPSTADEFSALSDLDQRAGTCEAMLDELLHGTAAPGSTVREFPKSSAGGRS